MRPKLRLRGFTLLALLVCGACRSARRDMGEVQHGALGGDSVARVGDVVIAAPILARVAAAQHLLPSSALGLLVDDALAAEGARAARLDQTAEVVRAITAARARLTTLRLREEARAAGPPTDAEVDQLSRIHWLQVDLPEQRRVIHAIILKPKEASLPFQEFATNVARDLAASEAQATSPEDFESRAKAFPHPGLELKVERLDPFVADGRVATPLGSSMDLEFAKAVFQLSSAGATSGVVATPFGWHVIRLLEILPEHRVPFEDRRSWFRDETEAMRAGRAFDRFRDAAERKYRIDLANGVDDLMTNATMSLLGVGAGSAGPSPVAP